MENLNSITGALEGNPTPAALGTLPEAAPQFDEGR